MSIRVWISSIFIALLMMLSMQAAATQAVSGGLTYVPPSTTPTLESIYIAAYGTAVTGIPLNKSQQFFATGRYSDKSTHNITSAVTWVSSNPGVVSINTITDENGLVTVTVTGTSVGATMITATLSGVSSNSVSRTVTN